MFISKTTEHRDYGGSSGTGSNSNSQRLATGTDAGPGTQEHQALDDFILIGVIGQLAQHGVGDASHISVEVYNRNVLLKGSVKNSLNISEIVVMVRQTPGVRSVESRLRVV
jgi:osmotically-inducible protein OsmY